MDRNHSPWTWVTLLLALSVLGIMPPGTLIALDPPPPVISYAPAGPKGNEGRIEVKGLSAAQLKILEDTTRRNVSLKVTTQGFEGLLGKTGITKDVLWFQPRFPLSFDLEHQVVFLPPPAEVVQTKPVRFLFTLPAPPSPQPKITAIYPTASILPENLLRFYVHFSTPMRKGEIYSKVRILDANGKEIGLPFLELDEELWNPAMTRVTLLIDPGRIKRGVQGRIEEGPVLEAGKSFVLQIDGTLIDAAGKALGKTERKAFTASAAVHQRIDATDWILMSPKQSGDPLEVRFSRPLDQAIAQRELTIYNDQGELLKGKISMPREESAWVFQPEVPWKPGNYQLRIGLTLEDLAGNRPDRAFDASPKETADKSEPILKLDFRVK